MQGRRAHVKEGTEAADRKEGQIRWNHAFRPIDRYST